MAAVVLAFSSVFYISTKAIGPADFDVDDIDSYLAGDFFSSDLDGDGDIDFSASDSGQHSIYWWENDGDENFTSNFVDDDHFWVSFVRHVDMDLDGGDDILAGSERDGIAWYENDGIGNFTKHYVRDNIDGVIDGGYVPFPIDMDDDQDGGLDVIYAGFWADDVS